MAKATTKLLKLKLKMKHVKINTLLVSLMILKQHCLGVQQTRRLFGNP